MISERIAEAIEVIKFLGLPRAQHNERSALTLLALVNLLPSQPWNEATNPLIGITPVMEFCSKHYDKYYAPNSRETFRRYTMHQFVSAGMVLYNPDKPDRAVNSPNAVYQIAPLTLDLLKAFGTENWENLLAMYLEQIPALASKYAAAREMQMIPVTIDDSISLNLTPGKHSQLIKDIIEGFLPRFAPDSKLIYVGDTGTKWGYFDEIRLSHLGVDINNHGKMPDVVALYLEKNWLLLIESVTSHGPVDSKRHNELKELFSSCNIGIVFVTAFPDRYIMARYLGEIAWETEVWTADSPTHLIHFNGSRFLGPY